jgi:hypothetical protein
LVPKKLLSASTLFILFIFLNTPAEAQYRHSYQIYISLGQDALEQKDYRKAYFYFETASRIDPNQEEAIHYLNLTKRFMEGRVVEAAPTTEKKIIPRTKTAEVVAPQIKATPAEKTLPSLPAATPKAVAKKISPDKEAFPRIVELNEELWQTQPNTVIEIELFKSVQIEGENIKNLLMVTPGPIEARKIDSQHVIMTAKSRGTSFFHLWQGTRRWTFRVVGVIPYEIAAASKLREQLQWEQYEEPFKFQFNNTWDSYYRGFDFASIERRDLTYRQWMGLFGQTPYGMFDGFAQYQEFDGKIEPTGYGIGLTDAKIGPWKDFTIRGFDSSKELSELSLSGKYFRGVLLDGLMFDRKLGYTYLQGQDRAVYGFLASGEQELRNSYIEGIALTYYPDQWQNYSLNYARGWGEARPESLKPRVYSLEGEQIFGPWKLNSEIGYDDDNIAYTIRPQYEYGNLSYAVRVRDIDKNYQTINGPPGGQGEVGGLFTLNWNPEDLNWNNYLDLYRDRTNLNEDNPDAVNVDFNSSLSKNISDSSKWQTDFYYFDTPGLLSTSRDVRIINGYDKNFSVTSDRNLTTTVRQTYQRSRSGSSPSSDFDRFALSLGFQTMLIRNLSFYVNYEQSFVTDLYQDEKSVPSVMTTGMSYSRPLLESLSGYLGIYYRDEEHTEKAKSFLAGEDSLTTNIGLTYQAFPQLQIFLDGYLRNVWAENPERFPYKEAEIRMGCRYDWDMPFSWNPSASVTGKVYKDMNGNGLQDNSEEGLEGIIVQVGKKKVKTNSNGGYETKVRAKKILVGLDVDSVPAGYVVTGPLSQELSISHQELYQVNFGLTTQSGIYGVVFCDVNQDGLVNPGDDFIPNVRITLDGTNSAESDVNGGYFFGQVSPGTHLVTVDINSIPLKYLPLIKLKNELVVTEGKTTLFNIPLRKK